MFVVNYPLELNERGMSEFAPLLGPTEVTNFSVSLNCNDSSDSWTIMWMVRILTITLVSCLFLNFKKYSTKQGRREWCMKIRRWLT